MTLKYTVRLSEIQEIYESYTGWYWFVTEYHEGSLAFGLVRGFELEWGYFDLEELHELQAQGLVWKVAKENWAFCPCVERDADSCSRKTGSTRPEASLDAEKLKGGAGNMEKNKELNLETPAEAAGRRDTILLCYTKAGNGFKVAHNGTWYYASRHKVQNVVDRKKENCLFVTIEDEAEPAHSG